MAFFGGGASVDLASPPEIGNTTPNTGAFTTLSFAPANNTTGFSNTSNSLTGSNAQSLINFLQTWNTTGTPTGLKFNITDTASNFASLIFDFQIGGTSRLSLRKDGRLNGAGAYSVLRSSGFEAHDGANILYFVNPFTGNVGIYTSASIQWGSGTAPNNNQGDIKIIRDTTGVLALQNGVNSQSLRLYNTFTDASNYERGFFRWNTNVLEIGAEAAGTGTQRQLRFPLGTVTASTPLSITQTWNSAGVTFTGLQLNATDTASASGSLLMDLQTGGTSRFAITKSGNIEIPQGQYLNAGVNSSVQFSTDSWLFARGVGGAARVLLNNNGAFTHSGGAFGWSNSGVVLSSFDTYLYRDAANIIAQRNSTNAQTFRLYRTFTDASNYERLGFIATRTTRFAIAAENAGTGAARSLEISFYTSASDPASTDITDGCFSVWKNSGTGTIKLWANDGGTMKSVALA